MDGSLVVVVDGELVVGFVDPEGFVVVVDPVVELELVVLEPELVVVDPVFVVEVEVVEVEVFGSTFVQVSQLVLVLLLSWVSVGVFSQVGPHEELWALSSSCNCVGDFVGKF